MEILATTKMTNPALSWRGRLLLSFCRVPGTPDFPMAGIHHESGKELDRLQEVFPDFQRQIAGKIVIDFGSSFGYQSVAFRLAGASQVFGIEINEEVKEIARQRVAELGLTESVSFARTIPHKLKADV